MGLAFFDRAGGRLRLTDAGQEVVNTTVRMEMLLVELGNTLAALKGKHAGRISVGVVSTAKYFAPRLIAAFSKENPRIDLSLSIGNRQETIKQLRDYTIDIALMGQPPADFPVISQVVGQHAQVVIAPLDHPLVGRRGIEKTELADENFIVREDGSGTRTVFDYFFGGVTVRRPHIKFEIGSNETIKQAVMAGLGLSLISAHTIDAELNAGRLAVLDVVGLPIVRQWFLVRRANWTPTPVGQAIWDFGDRACGGVHADDESIDDDGDGVTRTPRRFTQGGEEFPGPRCPRQRRVIIVWAPLNSKQRPETLVSQRGGTARNIMNIIQELEAAQATKLGALRPTPEFQPGDTVIVNVKVKEGERTRVQAYEGGLHRPHRWRPQRELHRPKDFVWRGRRTRLPDLLAQHRFDQGDPARQGAAREALLSARPSR